MKTTAPCHVSDLAAAVGSLPAVATQIIQLTCEPECSIADLARLIRCDNAMALRFLALANSAAYYHGREIRDLQEALVRLGLRRVRNVAFLMGMHDLGAADAPHPDLDRTETWKHTLGVAAAAMGLARLTRLASPEDSWLVGLLHGIGLSALAQHSPDDFARASAAARREGLSMVEAELQVLGFHHGELGGRILGRWRLPRVFAEAVEYWPEPFGPGEVTPEAGSLIELLRGAILFVRGSGFGDSGDGDPAPDPDDIVGLFGLAEGAPAELAAQVDGELRATAPLLGLDPKDASLTATLERTTRMVAMVGFQDLEDSLAYGRLEADLAAARSIQHRLLPPAPTDLPGFSLAVFNRPGRHVSGDIYDFPVLAGGRRAFLIADVSGNGMPAALLASNLQATLRALAGEHDDPARLLAAANRALHAGTEPELFATVALGVLDPDGTGLACVNAGHVPLLIRRADGGCEWLKAGGPPLGLQEEAEYPVVPLELEPGGLLVFYSDGLTEAAAPDGQAYGRDRLALTVAASGARPATAIASVLAAVGAHLGPTPGTATGVPQTEDDLTLLALARNR